MKTYRLYIMILVSAGIHLGAFGIWNQVSQTIYVSTDLRSHSFNVALTKPEPVTPDTPTADKRHPPKTQVIKPQSAHTQATLKSETKAAKPLDKPPAETSFAKDNQPEAKPKKTALSNEVSIPGPQKFTLLNNDMIKELQSEFQARFKYPMLARKRGWQGKVVLALHINLQGKIADIAIKRSSGYRVLDHNAVKTFKAIGKLSPDLYNRINTGHSFNIPIVYQLNGG